MAKKEIKQFDDEIDLFELIQSLWKEKVLIVAISGVVGGMLAIMFVLIRISVRNRKA